VLPPRSIAASAPALDRDVLRAIVQRSGPWPRTPEGLAALVADRLGRHPARWAAEPEDALLAALAARVDRLHLAMPAFGHPGYEATRLRSDTRVAWMEPARGRLDPGVSEVAEALDAGANAVLLTPLAGDCSALPAVASLCAARGALLAVDARASMAARVLDRGPAAWGDLCLVPVDAEGGPSPCPGAILLGDAGDSSGPAAGLRPRLLLRTVAAALRDEPRLRRLMPPPPRPSAAPGDPPRPPPGWAVAAAAARADQASARCTQRARHARTLDVHCSHLPAIQVPDAIAGHHAAGLAVPMLARNRDDVQRVLCELGVEAVTGLGAWLAPDGERRDRAQDVADRLLAVPLHPHYRPRDLDWLAERLRQATLRVNGDGSADPTEAVPYAAKAAGEA
jgi:hypothetical protein